MAKLILIANWKNYPPSNKEAVKILNSLSKKAQVFKKLATFIAPPLTYLGIVSERTRRYANLASQDIFFKTEGTHTGMVMPDILKSFGVRLSIIGHSERRELGESSEVVSQKVLVALRSGMIPLVCVGEKTRDQDGDHLEFLRDEIKASLEGVRRKEDAKKLVIAYEPIWAIGKKAKDAINHAELSQTIIFIRKVLTDIFGRESADKIPILYGGSVEPANADELMHAGGVRGFLIGHASLDAKSFISIAES